MTPAQKRRDKLAKQYVTKFWKYHSRPMDTLPNYTRIDFQNGWDARDRDLKEQLGLPEDCDIEEAVKGMKMALEYYGKWKVWDTACVGDDSEIVTECEKAGVLSKTLYYGGKRAREALKIFEVKK